MSKGEKVFRNAGKTVLRAAWETDSQDVPHSVNIISPHDIRGAAEKSLSATAPAPRSSTSFSGNSLAFLDRSYRPENKQNWPKRLKKLKPKTRNRLRVALAYSGELLGPDMSEDDAVSALLAITGDGSGAQSHMPLSLNEAREVVESNHKRSPPKPAAAAVPKPAYDRTAQIVGGGATPAELDMKLQMDIQIQMQKLHTNATVLNKELSVLKKQVHVSQMRTDEAVLVTRNALPAKFLREHAEFRFVQRFFDTLLRIWTAGFFYRWKREVRAQQMLDREALRLERLRQNRLRGAHVIGKVFAGYLKRFEKWRMRRKYMRWKRMTFAYRKWLRRLMAAKIQRVARGFIVRTRLNGLKRVAYFIQRVFRGFRTRLFLLRQRSATKMQKNWKIFWHHKIMAIRMQAKLRMCLERWKFLRKKDIVTKLAGIARGISFRHRYKMASRKLVKWWRKMFRWLNKVSTKISATYRGYVERCLFLEMRAACIKFQSCYRMYKQRCWFLEEVAVWREENQLNKHMRAAIQRAKKGNFHYRQARKIAGVAYVVTIRSHDPSTLAVEAYNPKTGKIFRAKMQKAAVFTKDGDEAANSNKLTSAENQNELYTFYERLACRLCERNVPGKGRIVKIKNHGYGDRGTRLLCRAANIEPDGVWIVKVFEYVGDYVVKAYSTKTCEELECRVADYEIFKWLGGRPRDALKPVIMRQGNEHMLLDWICGELFLHRRVIEGGARDGEEEVSLMLRAQLQEKKMATKVQGVWRRLKARRRVTKLAMALYRKDFDPESMTWYYTNKKNNFAVWTKPVALGTNDIEVKDEWEEVEQEDGSVCYYHALTGRWSWISPDRAATMVQRRYRKMHSADFQMLTSQLIRTINLLKRVRRDYRKKPGSLVAVVNFALFQQAIVRNHKKAEAVYKQAIEMAENNALVNYGYGLLLLGAGFYPRARMWRKAQDLFKKARLMDKHGKAFDLAERSFFYWALVEQPKNVQALVNFALVHQCIYKDMVKAEIYYHRALNIDNSDQNALLNFKDFNRAKSGLYGYA